MASKRKLLPCPFCGGEATVFSYGRYSGGKRYAMHTVSCLQCGVSTDGKKKETDAITAWNRRHGAAEVVHTPGAERRAAAVADSYTGDPAEEEDETD